MRRILSLVCGLGVMFGAAGPAWAQATADGAAKLKAVFETWLPPMEDLAPAEAEYLATKLSTNQVIGRWQIEPDGDGYRIRTPGLRTAVAETLSLVAGDLVLACDPEQWRATPIAGGRYALGADTSPTCRLEGEGGSTWPISAERRQTSGSVDPGGPGGFSTDTVLERIAIGGDGAGRVATIDRLTLSNGLKPAANGRSDLVQRYALEGVSFAGQGGNGVATADLIALDTGMDGADIRAQSVAAVALARRLAGLKSYPRPGSTLLGDVGDLLRVRPVLEKLLDGIGAGGRHETRIEGLRATIPEGTIRIGSAVLSFSFDDLDREAGSLAVRFESRGMAVEPSAPYTAWVPAEATLRISGQGLPLRTAMADAMLPGRSDHLSMARLLRESSMRILIDPVRLTAPEGLLDLTGAIWSNGDKDQKMPGRLQLRLAGVDRLVKVMQADADPQAAEVVLGLSVLQALGRQATTPEGRAARDYEIVFDPEGGILVNDADVRGLLRELVPEPR